MTNRSENWGRESYKFVGIIHFIWFNKENNNKGIYTFLFVSIGLDAPILLVLTQRINTQRKHFPFYIFISKYLFVSSIRFYTVRFESQIPISAILFAPSYSTPSISSALCSHERTLRCVETRFQNRTSIEPFFERSSNWMTFWT